MDFSSLCSANPMTEPLPEPDEPSHCGEELLTNLQTPQPVASQDDFLTSLMSPAPTSETYIRADPSSMAMQQSPEAQGIAAAQLCQSLTSSIPSGSTVTQVGDELIVTPPAEAKPKRKRRSKAEIAAAQAQTSASP